MTKGNGTKQEINLITLVEKYSNEDACRAYLEGLRWPDGVAWTPFFNGVVEGSVAVFHQVWINAIMKAM